MSKIYKAIVVAGISLLTLSCSTVGTLDDKLDNFLEKGGKDWTETGIPKISEDDYRETIRYKRQDPSSKDDEKYKPKKIIRLDKLKQIR